MPSGPTAGAPQSSRSGFGDWSYSNHGYGIDVWLRYPGSTAQSWSEA